MTAEIQYWDFCSADFKQKEVADLQAQQRSVKQMNLFDTRRAN
jgi:hypothetical protein